MYVCDKDIGYVGAETASPETDRLGLWSCAGSQGWSKGVSLIGMIAEPCAQVSV